MMDGLIDRLNSFLKNETYTFIQDSFKYIFNGYIIKVKDNSFIFKDDKLGNIEIDFSVVKKINYSNRDKG